MKKPSLKVHKQVVTSQNGNFYYIEPYNVECIEMIICIFHVNQLTRSLCLTEYQIFSSLVKQGPVKFTKAPPLFRHKPVDMKAYHKLPKDIQVEMREDFEILHERIFSVMRDMPSPLLLIFR